MPRGSTALDNYEYDDYLAKNGHWRELKQRKEERASAHKADMSGYHFGIADQPVKVKNIDEFRVELKKRGLGIEGECKPEEKKDGR